MTRIDYYLYKNKDDCKMGFGHEWLTPIKTSFWGDRKEYVFKKGEIFYRVNYFDQKRQFDKVYYEDLTYQGLGNGSFEVPSCNQFIQG